MAIINGFITNPSGGGSNSFLGYSAKSPVQQLVEAQKATRDKFTRYDESEDFLRMKAFEISNRIKLMRRLGQEEAVVALQAEGAQVVNKYLALQHKKTADKVASDVQSQVGSKLSLGGNVNTTA